MDDYDLLILNGLVVTASDIGHYEIAIKNGKIALLAPAGSLTRARAKCTIDAEGGYVMVQTIQTYNKYSGKDHRYKDGAKADSDLARWS